VGILSYAVGWPTELRHLRHAEETAAKKQHWWNWCPCDHWILFFWVWILPLIFGKSSNFFHFLPELWLDLSPISVLHMVLGIMCSSVSGSLFFLFRCNDHTRFVHIILSLIKVIDFSIPHGEKLWVKTELFGNLLSKKGSMKVCFLEHSML
jgi:hypothetical protein